MLSGLIRIGTVYALDEANARVQVRAGGVVSDWLPWITQRAGPTRTWNPPRPGEQVVVLSPSGDLAQGVVLAAIYQDNYPANGTSKYQDKTTYPDGSVVEYNSQTNTLTVNISGNGNVNIVCKTATVTASTKVRLDTPLVEATGDIKATGDVQAGTISLKNHKHSDPQGGQTGTPV